VRELSLKHYSKEQLMEMSFIEIAYELLVEKKQAVPFVELLNEIAAIKNLSEQEVKERVAQFYTDLNIDGRYMALGENRWGLRFWYPVDHIEEEIVPVVKPKKKKAKKVKDEDLELEDYDEVEEEEELEFDDFEEDDVLDDDFEEDELDDAEDEEDILEDDDDYDLDDDELEEDELELEDEDEEVL
jgi:DNA-directed RNA polymerase subunit delta